MINVGIIGSGFIVPAFIETTQRIKGFHYVGIASPVKEQLIAMKDKYHIDYYSLDNETVLKDPSIDVIYVAVPNGLHYEIAKKALECGKHVIVEKPFMSSYKQAKEIIDLAKKKKRIVFDAVTMLHMPNYFKIKELLNDIGDVKLVDINFSQYSSRYDKFKKGIVLPAFDVKMAGGALMDLGIYNINFVVGLFGEPKKVEYFPNMHKKVDTSGVLMLDYGKFKVSAVCAKDCRAPLHVYIEGDKGYIRSNDASSIINKVSLVENSGKVKDYSLNKNQDLPHYHEYVEFKRLINEKDLKKAKEYNEMTLLSISVLEKALKSGNIKFK